MMVNKRLRHRNCIIGAITVFILIACGKSPVWHSSISPETKSIELWYINVVEESRASDSLPSLNILKEEFGIIGRAQDYINAVKIDLINEGIMITDAPLMGAGTINVTINWPKVQGRITELQTMPPIDDRKPQPLPPHIIGAEVKLKKADKINGVAVELLAPDGHFLGKAGICCGDIKAEFTARVIRKLIQKGEYK